MANTSFPDSAVVYIIDNIPGQGEFQGTGVIIGPHTILTAAHLLYDADTGAKADAISLYPGFTPDTTAYNPPGALGGYQSIHGVKVDDRGDELSAEATQADFAVINTSVDLSAYGSFALDPSFVTGDVVVKGYPASGGGYLDGAEGIVSQDGALSDLDTRSFPLSPGYSGGPLFTAVERNGQVVDAVVGTVSTGDDAMKLTRGKIGLIRRWIASDQSLYDGGQDAPKGLVPQLAGTVTGAVDAATVSAPSGGAASGASTLAAALEPADFAYADGAGTGAAHGGSHGGAHHGAGWHRGADAAAPGQFADLLDVLHGPAGGDAAAVAPAATDAVPSLAAADHHRHHRWITGA